MGNAPRKKIGPRTLLLLVVSFILFLQKVSCDGILQVRLMSFSNPGGRGGNGHCCDGKWGFCESGGGCDHYFIVCIDEAANIRFDVMTMCKYGRTRTGTTHNQATLNFGSTIGGTPNPFSFNFTSWPDSVVVKVEVWDDDGGGSSDDIVDFVRSNLPLRMSSAWTTTTIQHRTSMRMELRAMCGISWYGVQCNVFCEPKRGPTAFYDCDNEGRKVCNEGWTGQNCDVNIDDCIGLPCQNEGQCIDGLASYRCSCRPGYTGVNCETNTDECVSVDCHRGNCVDGINQYTCQCHSGYKGLACDEIDWCGDTPCLNNGTCQAFENGFNCICVQGWTGPRCEVDIDECSHEPCRNALDCENTDGDFVCTCLPGWTGRLCEENIDECQSQPCANGGTCLDDINSYICLCTDDWTPASNCLLISSPALSTQPQQPTTTTCQQNGDGNICQNNGTCMESHTENGIQCQCSHGWTGAWCEEALDVAACSSSSVNPCLNGGLCVPASLTTSDQFQCQCAKGYSGTFCQERDTDESEEDNKEEDASAWTFRGLLKDEDISTLLGLIANTTTAAAADDIGLLVDRQSTDSWDETSKANDVDVWYKVTFCHSQSPEEASSVLLFRVTRGGKPIRRQDVDRILSSLLDNNFRFRLPLPFLSTDRECVGTMQAAHLSSESKFANHRWPVIGGTVLFAVVIAALIVGTAIVMKRRHRQRRESQSGVTNPIFIPAEGRAGGAGGGGGGEEVAAEWDNEVNGVRYTFDRDTQRMSSNLYMIPSHSYSQGVSA